MAPQLFDSIRGLLKSSALLPLKSNEAKNIGQVVPMMKGQFALEWKSDTIGQMIGFGPMPISSDRMETDELAEAINVNSRII